MGQLSTYGLWSVVCVVLRSRNIILYLHHYLHCIVIVDGRSFPLSRCSARVVVFCGVAMSSGEGAECDSGDELAVAAAAASDKEKVHEQVFNELMHEVKHGPPGARLSARIRTVLERMSPVERRAVVSRRREGCAPLFVAARRGNAETVEYLVHVCAADLEQRGLFQVSDDRSVHRVTPLWAAAVAGRLAALRALADAGADLDAPSDSGSTPVRSACFMSHVDAVRFLAERGADLHRPNHHGGTCLINSVQSARLCRYLIERGARVDAQDSQLKTVLHYAIQEHRADTARLLLAAGASPHLESRAGDDALRTACIKGAAPAVALLCARVRYPPQRLADAHELLGATQLDEFNDLAAALASWRRATALRHAGGAYLPKLPERPACAALGGAVEWRTPAELDALAADVDAMRTQALLVAVRVLGEAHKDTVFRLMYRGASYADSFRYRRCVDLWTWALRIRIDKDTLLYTDTCHTACALTRLLLDGAGGRLERARDDFDYDVVMRVLRLVVRALPECQRLIAVRPWCAAQADAWDRALRCVAHLALLAAATARCDADGAALHAELAPAVRAEPRTHATGDTLLHLACSRLTTIRSTYFAEEASVPGSFPSVAAARLLVACGAAPRARNAARCTPLHVAAVPYNFSTALVEALVAGGAHLDQPNRFGDSAAELVPLCRGSRVRPLQHTTLACLAARALLRAAPARPHPLQHLLPRELHAFLDLHRC